MRVRGKIRPAQPANIEKGERKAGTFQFWCAKKYEGKLHRDLGVNGTLIVKP
jgi:hypothetical protein